MNETIIKKKIPIIKNLTETVGIEEQLQPRYDPGQDFWDSTVLIRESTINCIT